MALGKALQGFYRTDYFQEVRIGIYRLVILRQCVHNEVSHSTAIKVWDEVVSVIASGLQCEEQCFLGETQRAAVCQQEAD